jgi:RNA 2',3'-cyclic 3'-phosphodiesterase
MPDETEYRWIIHRFQAKHDMMFRLFVAIRPPEAIRTALLSLMNGVEGARWQDDDQLHITLRFLGDVDSRTAEDFAAGLATIHAAPMTLTVSGVGAFDKKGRVHTLWAGVSPRDPLAAIHAKLGRLALSVGLSDQSLAYVPHITLARFGAQGGDVGGFIAQHGDLKLPPFAATEFALYESRLGGQGASYEEIASFALR